jgi:cytochrome c
MEMSVSTSMKKMFVAASCFAVLAVAPQMFGQKKGDAAKGKQVFEDNCSVCHNADSDEKKMGPGLKGLMKKAKMANGKAPTDANLRAIINTGGNGMPAFGDQLSDEERDNVVAYVKTL